MTETITIFKVPSSYYKAELTPVVYVDDDRAMFALQITPTDVEEDSLPPFPIALSYEAAIALGEAILETVEAAVSNYYAPLSLKYSENIESAQYHMGRSVLRVTFRGTPGRVYDYFGITTTLVNEWVEAESVGKFFNDKIVCNPKSYPFSRVKGKTKTKKEED